MGNKLAVDMKVARRRSGLSQHDVAALLSVDRTLISKFERGHRNPSGEQVALLSMIYEKTVPELYLGSRPELVTLLNNHIQIIETNGDQSLRTRTIESLRAKLKASLAAYGDQN